MANEECNNKSGSSSTLKVPPLKIVLSSHQNNTIVNISSGGDESKSTEEHDNGNEHHIKTIDDSAKSATTTTISRRNGADTADGQHLDAKHHGGKKNVKGYSDRNDSGDLGPNTGSYSSSSSSSSSSTDSDSSDLSTSTTPSFESVASNSTIIAEHQQNAKQQKTVESKDEAATAGGRQDRERVSRYGFKVSSGDRSSNSASGNGGNGGKRTAHDTNSEQSNEGSQNAGSKEQSLNANQRITRSSQRAAQQNKNENPNETNNEDSAVPENQSDKIHESARKAKRRKGEPQECEQDCAQTAAQLTVTMANIYPADYQLPAQNSFELYRDIRKRPYKKLLKLSHTQPKVPHGFKDYLLNAGPYLLDGNKLGVGLNGAKFENSPVNSKGTLNTNQGSRMPLRMKLSNLHHKMSHYQPSQQRHSSYSIPKLSDVPKVLQVGSPLYELFIDQEKARHQMRMQHLKERERSILAAEQEILRAYNRAAVADKRQKLHLSACTYFYYQERYHYLDEKSNSTGSNKTKEVPHNQDNSFLCIEGGEATKTVESNNSSAASSKDSNERPQDNGKSTVKEEESTKSIPSCDQKKSADDESLTKSAATEEENEAATKAKPEDDTTKIADSGESNPSKSETEDDQTKVVSPDEDPTKVMSDEDLKVFNKELFLTQLQEIDDKWDKIKRDMQVRHKNEADSLLAVQTLEWEWKAKEIGACDVRVPLKIEPEFVPRVEVSALDY